MSRWRGLADKHSSSDSKTLTRSFLSLRVHLSTAKLSWISAFLDLEGLDAIEEQLRKHASRIKTDGDTGQSCLLEAVKCLRAVLNTEVSYSITSPLTAQPGFSRVLTRSNIVESIALCLEGPLFKLRCQAADLLSALCILSPLDGHRLVLDAVADASAANAHRYRLQALIDGLGFEEVGKSDDDPSVWEWRASAMALINALVSSPEDVDARCELRAEFARRGLHETLTVRGKDSQN